MAPGSRFAVVVGVVAAVAMPLAQAPATSPSQEIDDGRRWLESSVRLTAASPAILRGAEAVALNRVASAEPLLRGVIRSQQRSEAAFQAHTLLSRIYLRSGQYTRLLANLDEWARRFPGRDEIERERKDVEQFRGLPDQENGPRRASILRHFGSLREGSEEPFRGCSRACHRIDALSKRVVPRTAESGSDHGDGGHHWRACAARCRVDSLVERRDRRIRAGRSTD